VSGPEITAGTCPHGISTEGDADAAACAFYADPAHLVPVGPAHKPQRPVKSAHVPVRFDPEMVAAMRRWSDEDGMTVSAWVRKLVRDEISRRDAREGQSGAARLRETGE
jgi:hypothetical protein